MSRSADPDGLLRRRISGGVAVIWGVQMVMASIPPLAYEPPVMVHTVMLMVSTYLFANGTAAAIRQRQENHE